MCADLLSCQIRCRLRSGSINVINAEDGTRCDLRSSNRCLNRACVMVGCDCVYGSTNIPSACGLCSNQAAKCIEIFAKYRIQHQIARDYHILDVPKGAYQVRIDIKTGSDVRAELIVTSTGWGRVSSSSGTRFAFGGEVSYTRNHTAHEESMEFYGPVEGELAIFMDLLKAAAGQSPAIDVSYIISSEYRQKAEQYNHPYGWKLVKASCSVTCGSRAGVQGWKAQCAYKRTGAKASISLCLSDYKPASHQVPCKGVGNCPGVVWQVGPWTLCSQSCGKGQQTRAVRCVSQRTKLATRDDDLCNSSKPPTVQQCIGTRCEEPATLPSTVAPKYKWIYKRWKRCSTTCGIGYQMRAVRCIDTKTGKSKKASRCDAKLKPTDRQTCTLKLCGPEPN
ncbi:A disintegrin and metalloproteinase with thrombospondin motifs 16-like [Corticium candelabrum]|uniref:A disintegrin and metalloproteinase with thrombospondin motifs 16-like n=1 Tax=Corticium candelabrum TaxID=121492 RepID=UPI002E26562E|nr:A disintegrin and metalloproteinase with thrombospondin motifs 16-like [Corticium candelabrum]